METGGKIESGAHPGHRTTFWARARDVIVAPARAFEAVVRNPSTLWQPLLAVALVNGLVVMAFYDRLVIPEQQAAIEEQELSPEEAAQAEAMLEGGAARGASYTLGFLGTPLASVVTAAAIHVGAAFLLGGSGTFLASWAAVAYTLLIGIVEWLVKLPVMLAEGRLEVFFGPALLLEDHDPGRFLDAFLGQLDLFTIWKAAVMAIGVAVVHRLKRRGPAFALVFGLWLLWALISAALGTAFAG
jgi:hypothetical protein